MIYILTGVAKSGKSLVAKTLMKTHHLQLIQTDHIMMMLHKGNPDSELNIHASDSTVSLFLEPYVKGLIETLLTHQGDYLIEGVHFLPCFAKSLIDLYPHQIKVLYLVYEHIDPTEKASELNAHRHLMDNPWFSDLNQQDFHDLCVYLVNESKRLGDDCRKFHIPYFEVTDIKKEMSDIIRHLIDK
ncbi:MAG: hypothetical protein RBQ71_00860 [Acholeplasmataceae bacterium]|jgi:hypothetical protein|nr:hypothetical protein [Acholeplasmataceae bacterium]